MRFAITGGAPLSPETHEFIRVCLGLSLVQGYSLTETTCSGTCMEWADGSVGKVGAPMAGMEIKLVNWEEGNYLVADTPRPRGEIIIGGPTVAKGYFKNDKMTAENFITDGGKRWFRTGDVGELWEDGTLRIIDRKRGFGQTPAGRICQSWQGGVSTENPSSCGKHLRLRRLISALHRGSDGSN